MTAQEQFVFPDHLSMIQEFSLGNRPLVDLVREIQNIYCSDDRPWIIGFSGGLYLRSFLDLHGTTAASCRKANQTCLCGLV